MKNLTDFLSKKWSRFIDKHFFNRDIHNARKLWRKKNGDTTLRMDYPLNSGSVVFDLGGYQGDFSNSIYERYGCTVYLFEPVKIFYESCLERFKNNPKIHCYNFGLGAESGTFQISDDKDASSLYLNAKDNRNLELIEIESFNNFVEDNSIQQIDLIKINIEGGEFDVLPKIIDSNYINNIKYLQIQFHQFIPDSTTKRENIRKKLRDTHDESWCFPFVWESWTRKPQASGI